jgi:alpha-galactosidase
MNHHFFLLGAWAGCLFGTVAAARADQTISVYSNDCALNFSVSADQHLNFKSLGTRQEPLDYPGGEETAYPTNAGNKAPENASVVALSAVHADKSTATDLLFVSDSKENIEAGVTETRFNLRDKLHPFDVTLVVRAYEQENVFEEWAEITQNETGKVTLQNFASGSLVVPGANSQLWYFPESYYSEMQLTKLALTPGCKIVDSKMGIRNGLTAQQDFILGIDGAPSETTGKVLGGTLAWSGSWRESFELDNANRLRVIAGINPYASEWHLNPGESFVTPRLLFTYSTEGIGSVSRRFHQWARYHGVRDGDKVPQLTLLNNWEATGFDYNEKIIEGLFPGAKSLGLEMFLLDDGWFGNGKFARVTDNAGLGDWQPNQQRFPNGMEPVVQAAKANGLKFGIWMEPEMVNPTSQLYTDHSDWVITQPNRANSLFRNQMILDLSRPEVEQFSFNAIDSVMTEYPGISFLKWDCNRPMDNAGSSYLSADQQSELRIRYVQAVYRIMQRVAEKYPNLAMMLCSGGGGRVDYGALRYFQEFWPSDDTDPYWRVFIQWGYSYFYPPAAACAHVTTNGNKPLKFCFDVAMSGRLGMDYKVSNMTPAQVAFGNQAVALYQTDIRPILQAADLYRLESPYDGSRASMDFVLPDKSKAILFAWQMQDDTSSGQKTIKLQGLDPQQGYRVTEVDLQSGTTSQLPANGTVVKGSVLMSTGLMVPTTKYLQSSVIELTAAR